jgi:hypothetical protein
LEEIVVVVIEDLIVRVYLPLALQAALFDKTGWIVADLLEHLDLLLPVKLPIEHVVARLLFL